MANADRTDSKAKRSSVVLYRDKLRLHVLPALGHVKVRELHRGGIKALLAEKLVAGLSGDSVRLIPLATVRVMLNAAIDDGVILANPADKLGRKLRLTKSKATRQEEIEASTGNGWPCSLRPLGP